KTMGEKVGFMLVPSKDGKRAISLGGQGMSVSTKVSKDRQEEAKKFIAWFLKKENQEKWVTKPAGFTANTEILASDAFKKATPYNAAFAESLNYLQDFWSVPSYNLLLSAATEGLGEALDSRKPVQQALDDMAKSQDEILTNSRGQ